jgi:hypothetical protein
MLWVKALHIVFVASWFAGLFYLPRIFVNLAMVPADSLPERERLLVMARKLYKFVTPIGALAVVSGLWLWLGFGFTGGWLHAKTTLVAVLRDPRDMLLNWMAWGSAAGFAFPSPAMAAAWLHRQLDQLLAAWPQVARFRLDRARIALQRRDLGAYLAQALAVLVDDCGRGRSRGTRADLLEVLRLGGLDAVPAVSLPVASPVPRAALSPKQTRAALARRVLSARGMQDCVTYGFLARETAALFGETPDSLRLENPIASDLDQMRPTPVASLAMAAARNAARGFGDVALAEIGGA